MSMGLSFALCSVLPRHWGAGMVVFAVRCRDWVLVVQIAPGLSLYSAMCLSFPGRVCSVVYSTWPQDQHD